MLAYNIVRFDIRGLSPGSSEDEAGIKEASELREKFCIGWLHVISFMGFDVVLLNLTVTDFHI